MIKTMNNNELQAVNGGLGTAALLAITATAFCVQIYCADPKAIHDKLLAPVDIMAITLANTGKLLLSNYLDPTGRRAMSDFLRATTTILPFTLEGMAIGMTVVASAMLVNKGIQYLRSKTN